MRFIERKYLPNGGLNADDAAFSLAPNQVVNMENCRWGSTDKGVVNTIESFGSTLLLSSPQPSVSFAYHGGCEDIENERIVYCLRDIHSVRHRIMCYDYRNGIIYTVVTAAQINGGLNFDKEFFIHSCKVVNGSFYFTDNLNQPRRINIDAGIKLNQPSYNTNAVAYTSPISDTVITVIRKPPNYTLNIQKMLASDVGITIHTNQIKDNAFYFTYFYTYWTGEESTLTEWSALAPYNYPSETHNIIQVQVPFSEFIEQDVQKVTVVVVYADGKTAFEVKIWDKLNPTDALAIQNHNALNTQLTYYFANNEIGNGIPEFNLVKPYDSVPLLSKTQEIADNRLFLSNNLMGYNTPLRTSLNGVVIQQNTDLAGAEGASTVLEITYVDIDNPYDTTTYGNTFLAFDVAVDATHPAGWYLYNGSGDITVITNYTYIGSGQDSAEAYLYSVNPSPYPHWSAYVSNVFIEGYITVGSSPVKTGISILKSDSARRIGLVFYDKYMRQCGVVISNSGLISIPDRAYNFATTYNYSIQWTLSNLSAFNEIPDWAYYYSIVSTNDLVRLSFVQARAGDFKYATKDADGLYVFTATTFTANNVGIGVRLDVLNNYGLGYVFSEGDILKLYLSTSGTVYTLSVIAQSGDWVVASSVDLGNIAAVNAFFEIYTPGSPSAAQFYYEQGNVYPILNPTTDLRNYLVTQGTLAGDIYLASRGTVPTDYITENMSPSDILWKNWFTNSGRLQLIDKIGQQRIKTSIRWSNTFIEGTRTNGLSSFDALDQKLLPIECGQIQKLQITSKVENELGIVMLAICEKQTVSLYMGEVQQYGSNRSTNLTLADTVIGSVNVLKGSFGTVNPESVTEYRGNVYWLDAINGRYVQYSANGLFPISNWKMTRFWKLWSAQYMSMTSTQIEALGGSPYVFTIVDPVHNELLISLPRLSNIPPKGWLPDYTITNKTFTLYEVRMQYVTPETALVNYYGQYYYIDNAAPAGYYIIKSTEAREAGLPPSVATPSTIEFSLLEYRGATLAEIYESIPDTGSTIQSESSISNGSTSVQNIKVYKVFPFDILDYQEKTVIYKIESVQSESESNRWLGTVNWVSEGFLSAENKLFSFKNGLLYIHNQTTSYNQVYGTQYKPRVMFVSNQEPTTPKVYDAIEVQANMKPTLTYFYNDYPYEQISDLVDNDYRSLEGKFYSPILRNKIVPTSTGYTTDGLLTAEKMRSRALFVMVEFTDGEEPLELEFVEIKFSLSRGHNKIK